MTVILVLVCLGIFAVEKIDRTLNFPKHFNCLTIPDLQVSTTDQTIETVKKIVMENHQITVGEVVEDVATSVDSCHAIFSYVFRMKFIPKFLNQNQRMSIAQELLNYDPELLKMVITGEEPWAHDYDVETKAQSSHWNCSEEPRSKKKYAKLG